MASVGDLFVSISANAQPALDAFKRVEGSLHSVTRAASSTTSMLSSVTGRSESGFARFAGTVLTLATAYRLLNFGIKAYQQAAIAASGVNPVTGSAFGPRTQGAISAITTKLQALGPIGRAAGGIAGAGLAQIGSTASAALGPLSRLIGLFVAFKATLAAIAAVVAVVAIGIASAFKSAAIKESIGAVDAIFKDSSQTVKQFAENVSASMGRSTKTVLDSAVQIGAVLKSQGFNEAEAAANSISLLGTAMELAAQRGTSTEQALNAVSAAIRGETDPIERLGISINEALVEKTIQGDANLRKLAQSNELAAKATARLLLIQQQSADAFGTIAKESGNLTQQMEKLKGQISQLFASLGSGFEPLVTAFVRLANAIMQTFGGAMPTAAKGIEAILQPLTWVVNKAAQLVEMFNRVIGLVKQIPKLGGAVVQPQAKPLEGPAMIDAQIEKFHAEKEYQNRLDALRDEMAEREKKRNQEIAEEKEWWDKQVADVDEEISIERQRKIDSMEEDRARKTMDRLALQDRMAKTAADMFRPTMGGIETAFESNLLGDFQQNPMIELTGEMKNLSGEITRLNDSISEERAKQAGR
jgi:hypothetical protein